MERKSGLWVASTPDRIWEIQGRPGTTRRSEAGLRFGGLYDQSWEGFGGCFNEAGWASLSCLRVTDREKVMQALFDDQDGCRLNLCRVPIGASDYALEWHSCNETDGDLVMRHFSIARDRQYLIPYIRMALRYQPKLQLFASPWSPPTWMKSPRVYNAGRIVWRPDILQAYALYLVRFVQAYRREGITIRQVHLQNEPAADHKSPSCLWSGSELRDFVRNHLGPVFKKQLVPAEIWLSALNNEDYNGYTLAVLSDPLARPFIAGVGYQGAAKSILARTHTSWPMLRMNQTGSESGDGQNSWAHARHVFGLLQHSITCGVNAFTYRSMVLPFGGCSAWGSRQNALVSVDPMQNTFKLNPDFHVLKHFAYFIDKNAFRLTLTGEWAGNAVAFANPDGTRVLVLNNPFQETRRVVLEDGQALLTLNLSPESFNTLVL
jgi:glucosylceramidase